MHVIEKRRPIYHSPSDRSSALNMASAVYLRQPNLAIVERLAEAAEGTSLNIKNAPGLTEAEITAAILVDSPVTGKIDATALKHERRDGSPFSAHHIAKALKELCTAGWVQEKVQANGDPRFSLTLPARQKYADLATQPS